MKGPPSQRCHRSFSTRRSRPAYVGASLLVLLIFSFSETRFSDAINNEAVAEQVVAMLVGSIGLIAAVPITTALAALLATRVRIPVGEHAHSHTAP
jgi:hypothetical protein